MRNNADINRGESLHSQFITKFEPRAAPRTCSRGRSTPSSFETDFMPARWEGDCQVGNEYECVGKRPGAKNDVKGLIIARSTI